MKGKKVNQAQCIEQGKRLKKCLKLRNMKQKDFANKTDFTEQYVSNMVNGKGIPEENIDKFAEILEVSRDYLSLKSNFMNMDELFSDLKLQQNLDDSSISFLAAMGYQIHDLPDVAPSYQVSFKPDDTDQEILKRVNAAKQKAKERPETMFCVVTPSGKRKQASRHDLLRILTEIQSFSRSYMELRIGK